MKVRLNEVNNPVVVTAETAKQCYRRGSSFISPDEDLESVIESSLHFFRSNNLLKAGHLTPFMHSYLTFHISGVSRLFVHDVMHGLNPFYNSEQQSQRYVDFVKGNVNVDDVNLESLFYFPKFFEEGANEIYSNALRDSLKTYRKLEEILKRDLKQELEKRANYNDALLDKKAAEASRYVIPIAAKTKLFYTINLLTLIRYRTTFFNDFNEYNDFVKGLWNAASEKFPELDSFVRDVDVKFVSFKKNSLSDRALSRILSLLRNEKGEYDNVRILSYTSLEPLKIAYNLLSQDFVDLNDRLGRMNISGQSKVLDNFVLSFVYSLSHSADSQFQRHRAVNSLSTPSFYQVKSKNYVMPKHMLHSKEAQEVFNSFLERNYNARLELIRLGESSAASYLLPNATRVYGVATSGFYGLFHEVVERLCLNAQEEIRGFNVDLVKEIMNTPEISYLADYLKPPCVLRKESNYSPVCPEGKHYCGLKVWERSSDLFDFIRKQI